MKKRWTLEEEQILVSERSLGKTYKEILRYLPDRTEKSLALKYKTLKPNNLRKFWSREEDNLLTSLYEEGKTAKEISKILNRPLEGLKTRIFEKIKVGDLAPRQYYWTEKELLDAVKNYPSINSLELANSTGNNLPSRSAIIRKFGSWNNALEKAGLPRNISGLKPNKETIIYLVYFFDEDFYKIGITQTLLNKRLSGYPEYCILDQISLPFIEAINLETKLLDYIKDYKYYPKVFGNSGHTECFKTEKVIERLENIYELF